MSRQVLIATLLAVAIGLVSCQTSSNRQSSEDHIHDLIRQARGKCGSCHDAADTVLARPDKSDMCDAVTTYRICAFLACNGGSSVVSLYSQAEDICDSNDALLHSNDALLYPSADRLHDLMRDSRSKCGQCHHEADTVLSIQNKFDICDAIDVYHACTSSHCYGYENVRSYYVQAKDICDVSSVVQISLLTLALAAVARFLF